MSSIAKGFAVQQIHDYLISNDLTNHLIDIGGEVILNGTNKSNAWVIGIQDPRNQLDKPFFLVSNDKSNFLAIATSGEYRNYRYDKDNLVTHFREKDLIDVDWINGGYFVCETSIFDYINDDDNEVWEQSPLRGLSKSKNLTSQQVLVRKMDVSRKIQRPQ